MGWNRRRTATYGARSFPYCAGDPRDGAQPAPDQRPHALDWNAAASIAASSVCLSLQSPYWLLRISAAAWGWYRPIPNATPMYRTCVDTYAYSARTLSSFVVLPAVSSATFAFTDRKSTRLNSSHR